MQGFARWIGMMAAAAAAVLAVVWLVEASPESETFEQTSARLRCESDRALSRLGIQPGATFPTRCPSEPRRHWDEPLVMRALAAGGASIVLLLMAAMVRRDEHS